MSRADLAPIPFRLAAADESPAPVLQWAVDANGVMRAACGSLEVAEAHAALLVSAGERRVRIIGVPR